MFGLTKKMRSDVLDKIEKQKDFLYSHYIELNGDKVQLASFFKNTFVNADRYIAELQHRVWSLVDFAQNRNLVNVFITLTLPSEYHRKKTLSNGRLVRNPKFAFRDLNVYDIKTKKRPSKIYVHEIKKHNSIRLNYWTGKITLQSLWKRNSCKIYDRLKFVKTFSDLVFYLKEYGLDIDEFMSNNLRKNVSLYDIYTRKRVFYYCHLTLKKKPVSDLSRWTGNFSVVSLNPVDYMPVPASKQLTNMWETIRKDRSWQDLSKDDRVYFRVTEPHKDGTPHLHISAWIPKYAVSRFVQSIHRLYPAPLADVATSYIPDGYQYYDEVYKRDGRWYGAYKPDPESNSFIKIQIEDTVSYLMKYIYKTLDDLRDGKGITEITMWYIYHGICRFYTSRTLISLNVYRPLNGRFSLLELTEHYNNDTITVLLDPDTMQPKIIQYDDYILWNKKEFELKQFDRDYRYKSDGVSKVRTVDIEIDGEEFYMYRLGSKLYSKSNNVDYIEDDDYIPPVVRMKMYQLWNYYHTLDPDDPSLNLAHFGLVHNTMIERGLIDGEIVPLSSYNLDFFDEEVSV